jgi:hypothetical protein
MAAVMVFIISSISFRNFCLYYLRAVNASAL